MLFGEGPMEVPVEVIAEGEKRESNQVGDSNLLQKPNAAVN